MSDDTIANVIATASLLLGILAALMGLWHADVSKAIEEKDPALQGERDTLRGRLTPILWGKAVPLALGGSVIASVFFHRAWTIACTSIALKNKPWRYDDLLAAMVVTEGLLFLLALLTLSRAVKLGWKCFRLWLRVKPRP